MSHARRPRRRSSRATRRCSARRRGAARRGAALPTLDPALLPVSPLDVAGARIEIPVLAGTTRDEATFLLRTGGRDASDDQVRDLTARLFTDPTQQWAHARAAAGGDVHLFRIDHASPDPRLGALHTIDVPLLFGTFATSDVARHYVDDDERDAGAVGLDAVAVGKFPARRAARLDGRGDPRDRRLSQACAGSRNCSSPPPPKCLSCSIVMRMIG